MVELVSVWKIIQYSQSNALLFNMNDRSTMNLINKMVLLLCKRRKHCY